MVRLGQVRERLRGSLWFVPGLFVAGAAAVAIGLLRLDERLAQDSGFSFAFTGGADSAQELLSMVAASMIGFTGVTFSVTMVVLQLASGQYSPRVLRTFLRDRRTQVPLGIFVATFVYVVLVLRQVRSASSPVDAFVPGLAITGGFVLLLASLAAFVFYIHHMAQAMRVESIIASVAGETRALIDGREPLAEGAPPPPAGPGLTGRTPRVIGWPGPDGVLQSVAAEGLLRLAAEADVVLGVLPVVGDFVPEGAPVLHVFGEGEVDDADLLSHLAVGRDRTMQQDIAFGFRQLVDIAERALSPGVNDPTTAVQALDQVHALLRRLGVRRLPASTHADDDGTVRVVVAVADWADYVALGVDEIRHYGGGSVQVTRRLLAMLDDLLAVVPPDRRPPLDAQRRLVLAAVDRQFPDVRDRLVAGRGDAQGLGS